MALATIRRFTDHDAEKLDASAQRFANRHGLTLDLDGLSARDALAQELWFQDAGTCPRIKELQRLWQACRCRALGVAVAADIEIAYGYVGHSVR
jgi:hypothetical protein